jgi:ubiquinol-cytochrome c reductase cytochrome b subunit
MHPSQFSNLFWSTLGFFFKYPTYPALGYAANFGFVAFIVLLMQIITGFFLSFHYVAFSEVSFNLLEHIMRDVNNG